MTPASKRTFWMAAVLLAVFATLGEVQAEPIEVTGKIEAVTVYRGQALVTRLIELTAPAGPVELIVKDLPERIVTTSLYASGESGMRIRAVRYRARAVKDEPRAEVRELDEQIAEAEKELRKAVHFHHYTSAHINYLHRLEAFTTEKVKIEMNKGTLDPKAVEGVSDYIFTKRDGLVAKDIEELLAIDEIKENIALLKRQREKLVARRAADRTAREAVIFLDTPQRGRQTLRLSYLVEGANWSPTYNARSTDPNEPVSLEYNALVQQMSGEPWDDVKLTLSTASPAMAADAPTLAPLWMTLTAAHRQVALSIEHYAGLQRKAKSSRIRALRQR